MALHEMTPAAVAPPVCSYLETVGRTPLVRLSERSLPAAARHATVLAKLEMANPGGSLKDRIALNMIERAEARGEIAPGRNTIVDFTSGNTGIGYAMVAAAKGYRCIIIMPKRAAMRERYMICRLFGAEVRLWNPALGVPGVTEYVKRLVAEHPELWWANQMGNDDNPSAHAATTAPEIWAQTGGRIDYFIAGLGTGGCLAGVGAFLKEKNPAIKIIAVEPSNCRVHVGGGHDPHSIVGIGTGVHSSFLSGAELPAEALSDLPRGVIDEWGHVSSDEAVGAARRLAASEGMMVGPSSGAVIEYALRVAARPEARGKTIVAMCASHAIRYTSHPLWGEVAAEADVALPASEPPCVDEAAPVLLWSSDSGKDGAPHLSLSAAE